MGCQSSKEGGANGARQEEAQPAPMRINVVPPTPRGQEGTENKTDDKPQQQGKEAWQSSSTGSSATGAESPTQLLQQLHQLTQTNLQLLDKLHASEARTETLKVENTAMVSELTQARRTISTRNAAEVEREALRKERDAMKAKQDSLQLERDQLTVENARLKIELADERDPVTKALREHRRDPSMKLIPEGPIGFKMLEKEVAQRNEVQSALNEHKAMLRDARTRELALQAEHLALTRRFGESQTQIFDQAAKVEELEEKLAKAERELALLREALSTSQSDLNASEVFLREMRSHLQSVESKQIAADVERKDAIATAQAAQFATEREAKQTVDTMRKDVVAKDAQIEELQRLLHSALHTPRKLPQRMEGLSTPIGRSNINFPPATEPVGAKFLPPAASSITVAATTEHMLSSSASQASIQQSLDSAGLVDGNGTTSGFYPTHQANSSISSVIDGGASHRTTDSTASAVAGEHSTAPSLDASSSLPTHPRTDSSSLDGDAEFQRWLQRKKEQEEQEDMRKEIAAEQATLGAPAGGAAFPFSPTKSQSLQTLPLVVDPHDPLLRSHAFPTKESEAEFAAWLAQQRVQHELERAQEDLEKENAKAQQKLRESASQKAAIGQLGGTASQQDITLEAHRPVTARTQAAEAEFNQWLAQQQALQNTSVEEKTSSQPTHASHQVRASWPHFQSTPSPEAAGSAGVLQVQQPLVVRKAWKDSSSATASNPEELKQQIFAASTAGRLEQQFNATTTGVRKPQHAATQSLANTLPSWAEGKSSDSNFSSSGTLSSSASSQSILGGSGGSASARSPSNKVGYTAWQSKHAASSSVVLAGGIILPAGTRTTDGGSVDASATTIGRELDFLGPAAAPVLWLRADIFQTPLGRSLLSTPAVDEARPTRRITGWLDAARYGNHAQVVSKVNRTVFQESVDGLHGAAAVDLVGSSLRLKQKILLSQFTLFVVGKVLGQHGYLLGGTNMGCHMPCFTSGAVCKFATRKSTHVLSEARSSSSSYSRAAFVRGRSVKAWLHGAHEVTSAQVVDDSEMVLEYIGQTVDETGPQTCSPASVAEIILFDRAMSDAERMQVDAYLARKFFGCK